MSWFDPPALVQKPLPPNAVVFPPEVKKGRVFLWVFLMAMLMALAFGGVGFALCWALRLLAPFPTLIRDGIVFILAITGAAWGALTSWTLIVESVRAAQRNSSS